MLRILCNMLSAEAEFSKVGKRLDAFEERPATNGHVQVRAEKAGRAVALGAG